jgi:hypothetical protein
MRLKAEQPEARNVKSVLLDGKPVPMVNEFDTDEGWVISFVADLPDNPTMNGEELVEDDERQQAGFRLVRRTGNVEVKFQDPAVDDRQDQT